MRDVDHDPSLTLFASSSVPAAGPPQPSFPSAAAVFQAAGTPGRTVYGPAVLGTMRVEDPAALAALARLRAPEVPRPAPMATPPMPAAAPWPPAWPGQGPTAGELVSPAASSRRALIAVLLVTAIVLAVAAALAVALAS
jgi:hypothetical protein